MPVLQVFCDILFHILPLLPATDDKAQLIHFLSSIAERINDFSQVLGASEFWRSFVSQYLEFISRRNETKSTDCEKEVKVVVTCFLCSSYYEVQEVTLEFLCRALRCEVNQMDPITGPETEARRGIEEAEHSRRGCSDSNNEELRRVLKSEVDQIDSMSGPETETRKVREAEHSRRGCSDSNNDQPRRFWMGGLRQDPVLISTLLGMLKNQSLYPPCTAFTLQCLVLMQPESVYKAGEMTTVLER